MSDWRQARRRLRVFWCWVTFQHLGRVHYSLEERAWWQCDNCGEVYR